MQAHEDIIGVPIRAGVVDYVGCKSCTREERLTAAQVRSSKQQLEAFDGSAARQ